ncbi:TonB-dependent receptor [Methylomonas methanica]|uniref:TonB-dependent receptor n=1 Tax=Methylomonas methanica TaxID=421 RepID=A0A177MDC3_METMH|nr:TonB-dependent receptor [Methylomonas methanica]OAI02809.1 TonB-dependent receptor [Methylomonas methanica]
MTLTIKPLAVAIALISAPAYAEDGKRHFDIPAQSLATALQQLSAQSGTAMLYAEQSAAGKTSPALQGEYTLEDAIRRLLIGSGLIHSINADGTVTLKPGDGSSATTLGAVTVVGKALYETDPYSSDYQRLSSSTATKTDTPIMQTPMSIKVVPQQVLKDQQVISIDQALRNVSGVIGGSDANREFFVRGFSTYNYYRDGFPFISNWFHTEDLANIDRVEVLKGPGSILYGRAEPGGIINFVTKQPLDTPYYSVRQQFGSYSHYRTDIDATGPLTENKDLAYRVNFAYQANDSITEFSGGERVFAAPMLRWRISDKTTSTVKLEYSDIKTNATNPLLLNPDGSQQGFTTRRQNLNDPWGYTEDEYLMFSMNTEHDFNDNWRLRHRFNASFMQETIRNITASGAVDPLTGDVGRFFFQQNADGRDYMNNFYNSLELTGKFQTGAVKHTLVIGGDYQRTDARATMGPVFGLGGSNIYNPAHLAEIPAIPSYNTFRYEQPWFGVYAQDQAELPYHIHILGGLRYDYAETSGDTHYAVFGGSKSKDLLVNEDKVSPRAGVLWHPLRELSLYGSYTENFGAANSYKDNGIALPPQTADQWETGIKTELFDGHFTGSLTYYDLKKQNLPMQPCQGCPSQAIGEAETRGLELDISGEVWPGLKLIGAYSYMPFAQTIKDSVGSDKIGKRLHNVPENSGNLWLTYDFQQSELQGLKVGAGIQAVGRRYIGYSEAIKTPGYATLNLMVSQMWKVGQTHVTAQLNADNLLDKTYLGGVYAYGMGLYGMPRTFVGSIKVEF